MFFFIQPLIVLGTKKALEMRDMIRLPHSDLSAQAWKRLESQLERERKAITPKEREKVDETKTTSGWNNTATSFSFCQKRNCDVDYVQRG